MDYVIIFKIKVSKTELKEKTFIIIFYNGLNKYIIDEIYKLDCLKIL